MSKQQYYVCIYYGRWMYTHYLPATDEIEATKEGLKRFYEINPKPEPIHAIKTFHEA